MSIQPTLEQMQKITSLGVERYYLPSQRRRISANQVKDNFKVRLRRHVIIESHQNIS
jgi:hypothetical protein